MEKRFPIPLAALLLAAPGLFCLGWGAALLLGFGHLGHPLLLEPGAAIAFIVSGIALIGSAGFPLVLRRLANAEEGAEGGKSPKGRLPPRHP